MSRSGRAGVGSGFAFQLECGFASRSSSSRSFASCALILLTICACAPHQFVPIQIDPAPTEVYLDQKPVELEAGGLELRADQAHVLYFKRPGYQPLPVVIETREGEAGPVLHPPEIRARLRPRIAGEGDVSIEEAGEGGE